MVFSLYVKQRIIYFDARGIKPRTIRTELYYEEGIICSVYGIFKFLRAYHERGTITRKTCRERETSKISSEIKQIVEVQMRFDNEHATAPSANKQRLQHFTKNYLAV